jgi:PAS domain S-box-containing protein
MSSKELSELTKKRLATIVPILQSVSKGDFSEKIEIPKKEDEFTELLTTLNLMIDGLRENTIALEKRVAARTEELNRKVKDLQEAQEALLNVAEDVDHKSRELAEISAKDEAILLSIGDGVVVTNEKGRIILLNPAAAKILGWESEKVRGKRFDQAVPIEDDEGKLIPNNKRPVLVALKTGRPATTTTTTSLVYVRSDGTRFPVAITATPVILEEKIIGTINIFRDVTQEKEVDKMKTEFVSVASHQLRTPLSAIKWFLEMVLGGDAGEITAEQRNYLQQVFDSNERMIRLVNDLLNVSRLETGRIIIEPMPTDLVELAKEAISDFESVVRARKQSLIFKSVGRIPTISFDPDLIRQVIQNLLSNATNYTPKNGEIVVKIWIEKEKVILAVKDTGQGIPKDEQNKIFTKFFRATNIFRRQPEGSGMGLYIAKGAIEASGGQMWFESEENQGSTFYFSLPLSGSPKRTGEIKLTSVK